MSQGYSGRETRIIRPAVISDAPGILACRAPGDTEGTPSLDRLLGYMGGRYHPRDALGPRAVFVAAVGARVVGYASAHLTRRHRCDGEVEWLYVHADHRRSGVATALVEALAAWLIKHEARRVCVNVDPHNHQAIAFYVARGARVLDVHWLIWDDITAAR